MMDWSNTNYYFMTKKLLVESLVIYAAIFFFSLTFDFWFNVTVATGINKAELHPYSLGLGQLLGMLFSAMQFYRLYFGWWKQYQ